MQSTRSTITTRESIPEIDTIAATIIFKPVTHLDKSTGSASRIKSRNAITFGVVSKFRVIQKSDMSTKHDEVNWFPALTTYLGKSIKWRFPYSIGYAVLLSFGYMRDFVYKIFYKAKDPEVQLIFCNFLIF